MNFRLLAQRVPGAWELFAGQPTGDQVVSWAVDALSSGLDTPTLRVLAGFSSPASWFEVEKDFRNSLLEMGLPAYPSESDARRFHAVQIAEEMLADKAVGRIPYHGHLPAAPSSRSATLVRS